MNYKNTSTSTFTVRASQVDTEYELTLRSVAEILQEASINHADKAGFGYEDMQKINLFWILTRMKIVIHKTPKWRDVIQVETWVVNRERFFTRRDFEIKNQTGEVLISATSGWMLIDTNNKRPQHVDTFPLNIEMYPEKLAVNQELDKISEIEEVKYTHVYTVKYSDLDFINHLNNTKYYRIILDTYNIKSRKEYRVKSFEINYLAEGLYRNKLYVNTEIISKNYEYKHEIEREKDKKIICRALINWQKR